MLKNRSVNNSDKRPGVAPSARSGRGQIALEAKDRVRERLGRSPDTADALAAAVWVQEAAPAPVPTTEIVWDPSGLFTEPPPGYVVDEDREAGWQPVRW